MRIHAHFAVTLFTLAACQAPPPPPPTVAEQAQVINEVFETPVAYSPLVLDSLDIEVFLALHQEYAVDSADIRAFYQRRGYQYAWFVGDTLSQSASSFVDLVSSAGTAQPGLARSQRELHGMVDTLLITDRGGGLADSAREEIELQLTARFFQFAGSEYGGFVKRDLRELDWFIPRRRKDVDRLLDSLVAGRMDLSPIEPLHPQYRALKGELKRYHDLSDLEWPALDMGRTRKWVPGDQAPAIALIRERLFLLGDLALNDSAGVYDSTLVAGVTAFQQRHGLKADAVIGKDFIAQLNVTPVERLRTLLVNMERLRWVSPRQPADMLLVNIPEFRLHAYSADTLAFDMDVVVGNDATRTVIFSDSLSRIVFSPTWAVPPSIVRSEILPAVKRNSGYLASKNMELVDGTGRIVPASSVDWSSYTKGIPYTVRQKSGPSNSLGLVKFLFPNQYNIYLHDTPAKEKFKADRRAFSHGCIRLGEPVKLAEYLLRNDSTWNPAAIQKAMHLGKETNVQLRPKLPVVIGYFTAWVDPSGRLNFRDDVYGHDARLAAELFGPVEGEPLASAVPR